MAKTKIEWTDMVWNPVRGCTRVSEGCRNCYAERMAARFNGPGQAYEGLAVTTPSGPRWTGVVQLVEKKLGDPLRWTRPRRVFVNSTSDLFHEHLTDEQIAAVFGAMVLSQRHTFQILTKRPERMRTWVNRETDRGRATECVEALFKRIGWLPLCDFTTRWPLPNVWLGVSVEDQAPADERIPELLATPAAVRFLSCEPLLDSITLYPWLWEQSQPEWRQSGQEPGIDWVIAGGESGPGARPMHPDWARQLRDQCHAAEVPFFFKQWGEWMPCGPIHDAQHMKGGRAFNAPSGGTCSIATAHPNGTRLRLLDPDTIVERVGKHHAGRILDGRTWDGFPSGG